MQERESNYDLLRIASTIAVVLIHISSDFLSASFEYNIGNYGFVFSGNLIAAFVLDTLPRFAVPCFVMLSGAFILDNKNNKDFKKFYRKSLKNIGVPAIIFSLLYTVYNLLKKIMNGKMSELWQPFFNLLCGRPFYHMWYLYMLLGLYLITPVILIIEENCKSVNLRGKLPWILLSVAAIGYWVQPYSFKLAWDIGIQAGFLGFYLVGYAIRCWAKDRGKSNRDGVALILLGVFFEIVLACLRYRKVLGGALLSNERTEFSFLGYEGLAPFVVVSSVLIFAGFSLLNVRPNLSKLSSYTFLIFLFQGGIWDVMKIVSRRKAIFPPQTDLSIIACVFIVLIACLVAAIIYKKIWLKLDARLKITNRLCSLFKLS